MIMLSIAAVINPDQSERNFDNFPNRKVFRELLFQEIFFGTP